MTTVKERIENLEIANLSEFATKSKYTKGRKRPVEPCNIRSEFQRDRDRIIHSKAFRRLKHKTQVFLSPFDDHFRTRLTHTLEVSQIARTISRALALNEDLTEAIALGHDLGHTPFGHCGEGVLNHLVEGGFRHNEQSVRVVEVLEDLNLCQETIDGIYTHSWGFTPKTPEAQVVQLADKIANISMSDECWLYTTKLREWMFENIYTNSPAKLEEKKTARIVCELYKYYTDFLKTQVPADKIERIVVDYISSMTDQYAIEKFKELFIPKEIQATNKDDAIFRLIKKDCYLNVN